MEGNHESFAFSSDPSYNLDLAVMGNQMKQTDKLS